MRDWENFHGRSALVTGGARRIGRALVLALAERGAHVAIHYHHSAEEAEDTAHRAASYGVAAHAVRADLAQPDQVSALIEAAARAVGPLDILIHSASTFTPGTLETTSRSDWDTNLSLHMTAPFLLSQAFARQVPRPAVILTLLDWRALRPGASPFAYTVSKAGLAAMTESLAAALAPRVRVNGLALGAILPPESGTPDANLLRSVPLERWGTVDEAVHAAIFLLAGSDFMTGSVVHVDGGRHLH